LGNSKYENSKKNKHTRCTLQLPTQKNISRVDNKLLIFLKKMEENTQKARDRKEVRLK
jgi:hypothetical protein